MKLLLFRFKRTNKMLTCTLVPEHLNLPTVFSGVRVSQCLVFCGVLFVFFLLAFVLSVILRLTDSGYPFGILNTFSV